MRRIVILAVLLCFTGCTGPEIQKPSWLPDTDFYTKSPTAFFDKTNEKDLE